MMDKVILGDNPFFAVNHLSDERSRELSIRFRDNESIIRVLDIAREEGVNTFMCTTYDRIAGICEHLRANASRYAGFKIYPCMPYAQKFANAVTELGIMGTLRAYLPGNVLSVASKAGLAYVRKDFASLMELLVDAEMKMFRGVDTPVIFLQNVITDLLMGLGMDSLLSHYAAYVRKKYGAEPGFITQNMPRLVDLCEREGIDNPVICMSFNKLGFRMNPSTALYEEYLNSDRRFRPMAMQVLAAGALPAREAMEYVCRFSKIESVLFGASSRAHIRQNRELIESLLHRATD